MHKNKYLTYLNIQGLEIPILFPMVVEHVTIANTLLHSGEADKVISAGFWHIDSNDEYVPYGESISLNIKANIENDTYLLNKDFNNGKIVIKVGKPNGH